MNGVLKRISPVLFVLILILVDAYPGSASIQSATIDARVTRDTLNGQETDFLVLLRSQANLRNLRASNRSERGRAVVGALHQAALAGQPAVLSLLDSLGASHRSYWIANLIAVHGGRGVVDALARRDDIAAIESDAAFRVPLETAESRSLSAPTAVGWGVTQIRAPELWSKGYTGQGIVYANADTGVQWNHPALKSQYRGWEGAAADHNHNWWDAVHVSLSGGTNPCAPGGFSALPASGTAVPCDDLGHGTHTMGIGVGDDGAGNQIGVAPGAKWIACRNMDNGVGRPSTYIECMQFFLAPTDLLGDNEDPDLRADVVGNSYACPPTELCAPDSLSAAIDSMRAAGIFMAVSAGNEGSSCGSLNTPPALVDSSITIGANDSADFIAGFSSRGPVTVDLSHRLKPDLVAPGVSVYSSVPTDDYRSISGTSMAAPHVSGAVALLWSAYPSLRGDVDATESLLELGAKHLTPALPCGNDAPTAVPNNVYGYGRVDVLHSYNIENVILNGPFRYFFPFIPHVD